MAGVAIGLIAFFIYVTARLAAPQMALLYGDLDQNDAGQISGKLESMKIPYEMRGANANQIWVPSEHVLKMRVAMAQQGIPAGGSVGYEIFDKSESLGTTNFQQQMNLVRALEGELARTIKSIGQVKNARVHLVMAKRELFSRESQEPSASIIIKTQGSTRLPKEQVLAIQHLVSAAVPKLKPERISIVDDRGNLLAKGGDVSPESMMSQNADEMRLSYQNRLRQTVEELLERSVGLGGVRAEVNVEMDFDRETTNSESFSPEGQVVRSTQTVEEQSSNESDSQTPVTVASNLPDANAANAGGKTGGSQKRNEETVNYEISKTVKNHVRETGVIKRLSVAVLVDGNYGTPDATTGERAYTARSPEEMDKLQTLVRSAIGFNGDRNDNVEVINMRFQRIDDLLPKEAAPVFMGLEKGDLFRMAEILVLSIVAILVILLVVRPLLSRAFETLPAAAEGSRRLLTDQSLGLTPALTAPTSAPIGAPATAMARPGEAPDELIDIDRVEGRVKASSVKKIGEIVDKHPEEALSILRNWMYQES